MNEPTLYAKFLKAANDRLAAMGMSPQRDLYPALKLLGYK